jgi:putative DNA primase/helicase
MVSPNYVETVANAIIEQLEQGTAPWIKPWKPGERFMPYNSTTGNEYHGMNAVWLMSMAETKGFNDTRWMTYKQAMSLDAQVNRGENGSTVQYWKWQDEVPKLDEAGNPLKDENGLIIKHVVRLQKPRVWSSVVFNAEQINGLPPTERVILPEWERHAEAEAILNESGAKIIYQAGNGAFYRPATDSITLPERQQFETPDRFYATALHELGHWTGHHSRLNRDMLHPFGSEGYAKEELRAEIASLMLGEQLSIGHDPSQHVAYIGSWIKALREDPREIFRVASDSEKIVKYLRGREMQQEQSISESVQTQAAEPVLISMEEQNVSPTPERVYLAVPYKEKDQAKAHGAKWDKAEKKWYALTGVDIEPLSRWLPDQQAVQFVEPPQDPQTEFAEALKSAGLILSGSPVMDGELLRVSVDGDKPGQKSGTYVGFSDGHPAGYINNYKTGFESNWKAQQRSTILTSADRERLEAEAAQRQEARAQERLKLQEQTADLIANCWLQAEPAGTHPYLELKGVKPYGLRINSSGSLAFGNPTSDEPAQHWSGKGELLIPVMDADGQFWGAQSIDDHGRKSFPRGCKMQGGHHVIGSPQNWDQIIITEGYATAATLHEALNMPVVVAFNSGNLPTVAEAIREKYPNKLLLIAGDNDHTKSSEKNVGVLKAQEAAKKVGGHVLLPKFENGASGSDWNDLAQQKGNEFVKTLFLAGLTAAQRKQDALESALSQNVQSAQQGNKAVTQKAYIISR